MQVASSNVVEIDYDDQRSVLTVTFTSGGTYEYSGVPRSVADQVMTSGSVGSTLNALVKNAGYPYTRIG